MPERIFIPGQEPDELPQYQSPELIGRLIAQAKVGDIAHIRPQGAKLNYILEHLGINQMHGCVDAQSTRKALVLWSTYFALNGEAFESDESRTFTTSDVSLIEFEKAEVYIPKATENRFRYGSGAKVTLREEGLFLVRVDSYFNGIISGLDPNGNRITGGANYFQPE